MVRGRGYAKSTADLEHVVLATSPSGVPVTVRDIGNVALGPDLRRGVSDLDGRGEVVSGIIVMRQGENALRVIDRVKSKIKEIKPGLPPGVKLVTAYDRFLWHVSQRGDPYRQHPDCCDDPYRFLRRCRVTGAAPIAPR